MLVKVDCSMKGHLESFFEFVKNRAQAPEHKPNADIIADFVESFLVIEMKRLEAKDETYEEGIEFSEDLILGPLKEAKRKMDDIFNDFLKNRGTPTPVAPPTATPPAGFGAGKSLSTPAVAKPRSGNGHKKEKIRSLLDSEKDHIRTQFSLVNGQIADDACVGIKGNPQIGAEISIFQVTGFVTYLHKQVAMGKLILNDINKYLEFLQGHRDLWARYNSPKYQAMRAGLPVPAVAIPAVAPVSTIPKFTSFPKR
jgi:hypothetical protein